MPRRHPSARCATRRYAGCAAPGTSPPGTSGACGLPGRRRRGTGAAAWGRGSPGACQRDGEGAVCRGELQVSAVLGAHLGGRGGAVRTPRRRSVLAPGRTIGEGGGEHGEVGHGEVQRAVVGDVRGGLGAEQYQRAALKVVADRLIPGDEQQIGGGGVGGGGGGGGWGGSGGRKWLGFL